MSDSKLLDAGGGVNVGAPNRRKVRTISETASGKTLGYTTNADDKSIVAGNDPRVEAAKAKIADKPAPKADPFAEAAAKAAAQKAEKEAAKAAADAAAAEAIQSDDDAEDDESDDDGDAETPDESEAG